MPIMPDYSCFSVKSLVGGLLKNLSSTIVNFLKTVFGRRSNILS